MIQVPETLVVDSHVHFWDRDVFGYPWLDAEPGLRPRYLPSDLVHETADLGGRMLAGVIAVQADCRADQAEAETAWLQRLADAGAPVLGIVAHAPLECGDGAEAVLGRSLASPHVVGIRRLLQDEPAGFSSAAGFVDGVRLLAGHGLVMDLCVRDHQLREMARLVERCPAVEFVLDHAGKPTIDPAARSGWAQDLARLAALPNISCKLSGLSTEARGAAGPSTFQPWLRQALESFGPGRCLFGSDWPVVSGGLGYGPWFETVLESLGDLTDEERSRVLSGNALAVYDPLRRGARAEES